LNNPTPASIITVNTDVVYTTQSIEYFLDQSSVWDALRQYQMIHPSGVRIDQAIAIGYDTLQKHARFTDIFDDFLYIYDDDGEHDQDPLTIVGYAITFKIWHCKKKCFTDPVEACKYLNSILPF
jgi:hypothetical protein